MKEFTNKKHQKVGYIDDNKVFRKTVRKSKHLMEIYNAWGMDKSIFDEISSMGCVEIRIKDLESGQVYSTTVSNFKEHQIENSFDGKQVFLPLKYWELSDDMTMKLL